MLNTNCSYCEHTNNLDQNQHANCSECDQLFNKDELNYVAIHPHYNYQILMCQECEQKIIEIMMGNNTISNIVIDWLEQHEFKEFERQQDWKEKFGE